MNDPDFVYVVCIKATPQAVWEALTQPEFTEQYWWGARCQSDWSVGAVVRMERDGGLDFDGLVLEAEPHQRLVYTFQDAHACRGEGPTTVSYALMSAGGVTRLTVTHSGFIANSQMRRGVERGWPVILSGLKTWLETGERLPVSFALQDFEPGEFAPAA